MTALALSKHDVQDPAPSSNNVDGRVSRYQATVEDERAKAAREIAQLTRWLDSAFRIPGTNVRMGLDGLLGLLPGIGDVLSQGLSGYIIYKAHSLGTPKRKIARMIGNTAIDTVVGSIPLVGDIFDILNRANTKNLKILQEHLDSETKAAKIIDQEVIRET